MNNPPDDLDRLLNRWASKNEPSAERIDRLKARIAEASKSSNEVNLTASGRWNNSATLAMAISLLALLLLVAFWPFGTDSPAPVATLSNPETDVPQEHLQTLFAEMERLFDSRLAWVAETENEVSLGIDPSPQHASSGQRVGVRVVVLKRDLATAPWKAVWTGDVAARSEEFVSLASESGGARLNLWTFVLPDGAVTVDMELAGLGAESATWRSNSVQQPQVPIAVLSARQGNAEIQIWQTAIVLQENTL
jgi:hypothetical protein